MPAKTGKGGIPSVLKLCTERMEAYFADPELIPSLNLANGSPRQQRSERRESCVLTLKAALKYMDLRSMRVGMPTRNGFRNFTVGYLAKQTGMTLKRVERALADLKDAGLVTLSRTRKRLSDGSWQGLAAIKTIPLRLFAIFGLDRILKKERAKRAKAEKRSLKWQRDRERTEPNGAGQASIALAMKKLNMNKRTPLPESPEYPRYIEHKRHLGIKMLELKQAHPDWSHAELEKEARRLIAGLFPDYVDNA